jgi:hypothetical protein
MLATRKHRDLGVVTTEKAKLASRNRRSGQCSGVRAPVGCRRLLAFQQTAQARAEPSFNQTWVGKTVAGQRDDTPTVIAAGKEQCADGDHILKANGPNRGFH